MLNKSLATGLLSLLAVTACESKHKSNYYPVTYRQPIALNSAADIQGSWTQCVKEENKNKSGLSTYTFDVDGTLHFDSATFETADCQGVSANAVKLKGTYAVGDDNALDMSFNMGTVYRVFSVKDGVLLISNNQAMGQDADHRDFDLGTDVLRLNLKN